MGQDMVLAQHMGRFEAAEGSGQLPLRIQRGRRLHLGVKRVSKLGMHAPLLR
jgi:hypothetical protein